MYGRCFDGSGEFELREIGDGRNWIYSVDVLSEAFALLFLMCVCVCVYLPTIYIYLQYPHSILKFNFFLLEPFDLYCRFCHKDFHAFGAK